jgi:hypothetical protein
MLGFKEEIFKIYLRCDVSNQLIKFTKAVNLGLKKSNQILLNESKKRWIDITNYIDSEPCGARGTQICAGKIELLRNRHRKNSFYYLIWTLI